MSDTHNRPHSLSKGQLGGAETPPEPQTKQPIHIATRILAGDYFTWARNILPDPDRIIARLGWNIERLRTYILEDTQVETVWGNSRLAALTASPWQVEAGGDSPAAYQAADGFREMISGWDNISIMEQLMDARAIGYAIAEYLWAQNGSQWTIDDLVPKPSYWFRFSPDDQLLFMRRGALSGEPMPANRFMVIRNRARYNSPYGQKLFAKLFWLVTFRKHGLEWWMRFVERFGAPSMYVTYDPNANEEQKNAAFQMALDLFSSGAAAGPEGSQPNVLQDVQRQQSGTVHNQYMEWLDKAIAKAVTGQNLTSDSGEKGTQALGTVQERVLDAITLSDRHLIASGYNQAAYWYTLYNFGQDVPPPVFSFETEEDLKPDRVERDGKLYQLGWRPTASYIARHYDMGDEDFTLDDSGDSAAPAFSARQRFSQAAQVAGDEAAMEQFAREISTPGQAALDDLIDDLLEQAAKATDFDGSRSRVWQRFAQLQRQTKRKNNPLSRFAGAISNLRHMAHNYGHNSVRPPDPK